MTREEALNYIQHKLDLAVDDALIMTDKEYEIFSLCAKALEQELCEDCISRQAVLKQLKGCLMGGETEYNYVKLHIDSLPSVAPQPKIGYWIEHPHECGENWEYSRYECSICHNWEDFDDNFCPNCGAKMEGSGKE